MNVRKTPQEEGQPMRARRAVLTGGAVGLAAVAGAAFSSSPPAAALTYPPVSDWLNVLNYGADPTGGTDSASAFNNAIIAAAAQNTDPAHPASGTTYGGVVYVPSGVYMTKSPILLLQQVMLLGAFPASAAMTSKPTVSNPLDYAGSIIQPSASWGNGGDSNAGVIYVNGGTAGISRPAISNLWVDGSNLANAVGGPNLAALAGISVYGGAAHGEIYGVGVYGMPTSGMYFAQDGSSRTDGWTLRDCIVQTWGTGGSNYGIYWEGDDSQFVNVHAQAAPTSTAGGSCWYVAAGGNNRWIACRADQSADSGWVFDSDPGGSPDTPGTANMLIGCGTENNANYGLHLINSNASVKMRIPVIAVGCAWGFDGRAAPTNGGAAACVEGYNTLFLDNCNVGTNEASNVVYPEYGLVTNIMGGSAPALIRATGGIWNCGATSPVNDVAAMGFAGGLSIDVHSVTGGMWVTPGVTSSVPVSSTIAPYNNVVSTGAGDVAVTQPSVPPTSGANTTNNTGYDVAVYVTGSGVTKVKVNGTQVLDGAPATVYLRAGDTIAVAWSTLPTWIWQAV
jgi:Pectate lyase superfamily protein